MATVRNWLAKAMGKGHVGSEQAHKGPEAEFSEQQREAVERGVEVVRRYGGVLLADAVGLGKTRVALQMARRLVSLSRRRRSAVEPALFVVPARLRRDWERAIAESGWNLERDARVITHHWLSRQKWDGRPSVVVVDEAHKFRNPSALRSQNLARITARTQSILVTATPVCTSRRDLFQLLSYFLSDEQVKLLVGMGLSAAFAADEAGEFDVVEILEEVVIRRKDPDFGAHGRPGVRFEILTYDASGEEAWLWRNLEPTLRSLELEATGKYWPSGLMINTLMRMWESGPGALSECLGELLHFHERWLEAARAGERVERPEFRVLFNGVSRQQQVFRFLYRDSGGSSSEILEPKRIESVRRDRMRLESLFEKVEKVRTEASGMVDAIVDEVWSKPEEPFLIFTAFRASAEVLFDALRRKNSSARVGLVTGDEARATGLGRSSADEVVERFMGAGLAEKREHEKLRILVATDCLSEGVNLQQCSRLILADLPYSPVRLEQRIGRIARPGSIGDSVTIYLPRPRSWADSLGMRRRLSDRLTLAQSMGAGHELAQVISDEDERCDDEEGPGPLAAMTLEERLWSQIRGRDDGPDFARRPSSGRQDSNAPEGLWVRVKVEGTACRHLWVWVRDREKKAVVRLSEQLSGLAMLSDDPSEVEEWEPGGVCWEVTRAWMRRRQNLFEAARLAPPLVGQGSESLQIWRRLERAVDDEELNAERKQLETWRRKLLRAHPSGIRFEMSDLLKSAPSSVQMVRFVEGLPEPPVSKPVVVEAVAALFLASPTGELL